jgi:hypothetical protein
MGVIAIANDGVQKRAHDNHSAFNERNVLNPRFALWPRTPTSNCDWKYHEQPDVVEHSDQLLMGHV